MTMPLFRHRRGPEWWWGGRKETYGEAWLAPGRACDAPFPETERTRVSGGAGGMAAVGSGRGRKQRRAAGRRRKRRASALLQYSFTAAAVWPGEGSEGEPRARVAGEFGRRLSFRCPCHRLAGVVPEQAEAAAPTVSLLPKCLPKSFNCAVDFTSSYTCVHLSR